MPLLRLCLLLGFLGFVVDAFLTEREPELLWICCTCLLQLVSLVLMSGNVKLDTRFIW